MAGGRTFLNSLDSFCSRLLKDGLCSVQNPGFSAGLDDLSRRKN